MDRNPRWLLTDGGLLLHGVSHHDALIEAYAASRAPTVEEMEALYDHIINTELARGYVTPDGTLLITSWNEVKIEDEYAFLKHLEFRLQNEGYTLNGTVLHFWRGQQMPQRIGSEFRWWLPNKTAADIRELAARMKESLLGDGKGKPPRADLAKLLDERVKLEELVREFEMGDGRAVSFLAREAWSELAREAWSELDKGEAAHDVERYLDSIWGYRYPNHLFPVAVKIAQQVDMSKENLWENIVYMIGRLNARAPESYKIWPWAVREYKRVHQAYVTEERELMGTPDHYVDIVDIGGRMLHEMRQRNRIPRGFDINQLTFEEFERWVYEMNQEMAGESWEERNVVWKTPEGWTIEDVRTASDLAREGELMGHCVGGYCDWVQSGRSKIFSLRDPKGIPHVTMEFRPVERDTTDLPEVPDDMNDPYYLEYDPEWYDAYAQAPVKSYEVIQIQGKQNTSPKPEYRAMIRPWIESLRMSGIEVDWSTPHSYPFIERTFYPMDTLSDFEQFITDYEQEPEMFREKQEAGVDDYGIPVPAHLLPWKHELDQRDVARLFQQLAVSTWHNEEVWENDIPRLMRLIRGFVFAAQALVDQGKTHSSNPRNVLSFMLSEAVGTTPSLKESETWQNYSVYPHFVAYVGNIVWDATYGTFADVLEGRMPPWAEYSERSTIRPHSAWNRPDAWEPNRWWEQPDTLETELAYLYAKPIMLRAEEWLRQNYHTLSYEEYTRWVHANVVAPLADAWRDLPVDVDDHWRYDRNEFYRQISGDPAAIWDATDMLWDFYEYWKEKVLINSAREASVDVDTVQRHIVEIDAAIKQGRWRIAMAEASDLNRYVVDALNPVRNYSDLLVREERQRELDSRSRFLLNLGYITEDLSNHLARYGPVLDASVVIPHLVQQRQVEITTGLDEITRALRALQVAVATLGQKEGAVDWYPEWEGPKYREGDAVRGHGGTGYVNRVLPDGRLEIYWDRGGHDILDPSEVEFNVGEYTVERYFDPDWLEYAREVMEVGMGKGAFAVTALREYMVSELMAAGLAEHEAAAYTARALNDLEERIRDRSRQHGIGEDDLMYVKPMAHPDEFVQDLIPDDYPRRQGASWDGKSRPWNPFKRTPRLPRSIIDTFISLGQCPSCQKPIARDDQGYYCPACGWTDSEQ